MKLAYIDSSAWITRIEGLEIYRKSINDCFNKLISDGWLLCTSEVVSLEILPKLYKDKNDAIIEIYNNLFQQTYTLKTFSNVFEQAMIIAQTENLKAMDAIHVAIAVKNGCQCFVSTDKHFKNLKIISPVWINLSTKK